jgi:3-oxoacyl-[acyl-carrier protein] reductase
MINFNNKIALITGASGSIGSACARLLHSLGATVILTGTNEEKLSTLSNELGSNASYRICNLANLQDCQNLIQEQDNLDILVCNAGITKDALSLKMSLESFQSVLDVNLTASFMLNKIAIKQMLKKQYGRIINISSVVGFAGNPGQANYCASKAGLVGMSKALAQEVARRNITINCVAPGFIESDITGQLSEEQKNVMLQKIPAARFGSPLDVANAVAFIASDAASYMTGSTIHVNGGMLML